MITILLLFIAILIILIKWYWDNRALYFLSRKIPGPQSYPIIGNIGFVKDFIKSEGGISNPIKVIWQWYRTYDGLFCGWVGPYFHIFVIDPSDIESTYSGSLVAKPPHLTNWWSESLGEGLITMTATKQDRWKSHKKILSPTLAPNLYKSYYEGFRKQCHNLVDDLGAKQNKGFVDVSLYLSRYCADAITDSMYGTPMNFRTGDRDSLLKAFHVFVDNKICQGIVARSAKFWYNVKIIYDLSSFGKEQKKCTKKVMAFANELLDARLELEKNQAVPEHLLENSVIGSMMRSYRNRQITKDEVIGEIINMWAGGSETTGITFQFLLTCLAINKDCQNRAFAEVRRLFDNDRNSILEYEDIDKFPYIENCLKESLRLFATGPITLRYSTQSFLFKSKNIIIPPNVTFVLLNSMAQRNPKIWDKPDEYDPDRWTPENSAKRHPCSYSPFSGGPRKCPGRAFARKVIIPALVLLLKNFEFHCPWKLDDIPLHYGINVTTPWGCKVTVTERKW